jgi:hypothetical protein
LSNDARMLFRYGIGTGPSEIVPRKHLKVTVSGLGVDDEDGQIRLHPHEQLKEADVASAAVNTATQSRHITRAGGRMIPTVQTYA